MIWRRRCLINCLGERGWRVPQNVRRTSWKSKLPPVRGSIWSFFPVRGDIWSIFPVRGDIWTFFPVRGDIWTFFSSARRHLEHFSSARSHLEHFSSARRHLKHFSSARRHLKLFTVLSLIPTKNVALNNTPLKENCEMLFECHNFGYIRVWRVFTVGRQGRNLPIRRMCLLGRANNAEFSTHFLIGDYNDKNPARALWSATKSAK